MSLGRSFQSHSPRVALALLLALGVAEGARRAARADLPSSEAAVASARPRGEAPVSAAAPRKTAPQLAAPALAGRFARLTPVKMAEQTYYPYSFDGHVHTHHSPDAFNPPLEVLAEAERVGLSAIVITDHGSSRAKLEFGGHKGQLVAFAGQEIGGPFGHAVFWNVAPKQGVVPSDTSLRERAAFAHEHGGLIVLCHPGWWIRGREKDPMEWITPAALAPGGISSDIDALELWNGVYDAPLRKLITAWEDALEAGAYVPIVGNSDFHRLGAHRIGGPRNVAYCTRQEPESCLWDAVKAGRLYVSDGPSLALTVDGQPLGGTAQGVAGRALDVHLQSDSPQGGELRVLIGRTIVETAPLDPRAPLDAHVRLTAPATNSYLRVEIVRTVAGSEQVLLLSNPIRLRLAGS